MSDRITEYTRLIHELAASKVQDIRGVLDNPEFSDSAKLEMTQKVLVGAREALLELKEEYNPETRPEEVQ